MMEQAIRFAPRAIRRPIFLMSAVVLAFTNKSQWNSLCTFYIGLTGRPAAAANLYWIIRTICATLTAAIQSRRHAW